VDWNYATDGAKKFAQVVTLLTYSRGRSLPLFGCSWIYSAPPGTYTDCISERHFLHPPSFQIQCFPTVMLFDLIQTEMLTASLNKQVWGLHKKYSSECSYTDRP